MKISAVLNSSTFSQEELKGSKSRDFCSS